MEEGPALIWGSLAVGMLAGSWARRVAAIARAALTITLCILNLPRAAERLDRTIRRPQNVNASDMCAAVNLTMQTESDRTGLLAALT
ncbi:MAG: hypothetical protein JJU42_12865 [Rhodobacteraceae bacterium]|nr:hypothetical protein [Paracoccaceae bacterium]